jgi:protein O-mannosyl-transferase
VTGAPRGAWLPVALIAGLAAASVLTGLGNGFAYDDVELLVNDSRLHTISSLPERVAAPWWPTGLFRPVSLGFLGLQWIVGDGSPLVFRLVSTALYAIVATLVFLVCRQVSASLPAALAGAAVFAVHPVHSEVTANVVGQAEMLSAIFVLLGVFAYVAARRGGSFSGRSALGITVLFLLAAHAKEGGYVLLGLLVAAELLVVKDPRPFAERISTLREGGLLLLMAFMASLAVRQGILGGLGGETPHEQLAALSLVDRAAGMLAIVPEWVRLLVWPARLQVEYGPPGLVITAVPGLPHLLGASLLGIGVVLWVATRLRAPVVALGIAWAVIGLAPVANVVFPTGLLLAERTLFLPSVGVALVIAGAADLVASLTTARSRRWVTPLALSGLVVLIVFGLVHSRGRQPVWRDNLTLHAQSAAEAPRSYRAQMMYGRELANTGDTASAIQQYNHAILLWKADPRPFRELGQILRVQGNCAQAIPLFTRGLSADSLDLVSRSRLVECLILERRWDEAEGEIRRGLAQGVTAYQNVLDRVQTGRRADLPR